MYNIETGEVSDIYANSETIKQQVLAKIDCAKRNNVKIWGQHQMYDILKYIKEKYGLIAHTSYIAEIKRKHGIKMINVRSNEDTLKKAKHPTLEMTKAIEDALIRFGIIE